MSTSQIQQPALNLPPRRAARRRPFTALFKLVLFLLIGAALVAIGAMGFSKGRQMLAGGVGVGESLLTFTVQPRNLRVTVLESGTMQSASSVNVYSELEGTVAIINLVPEGTRVEQGDIVVELDSSSLSTRLVEQRIVVQRARGEHSQAVQAEKVAISQAASDTEAATRTIEFAKLDLTKYIEGDYPQELRVLTTEITLAQEELKRAEQRELDSRALHEEGYLSEGEYEADKLSMLRGQVKLELAQVKETLLREYTHARRKRELESKVTEAERALERVMSLAEVGIEQAKTTLETKLATLELEQARLAHLQTQLERTTMRAPQAGVVVYPVPEDDDLVELYIKQGTVVREQQHIFSIPDTDIMQVSTSLHEVVIDSIEIGMPARIWSDLDPDVEIRGEVTFVSPLPEHEDWRRTTVKFYETHVKMVDQVDGQRPGLSTKVEILIDELKDVLAIPVQAVWQHKSRGVCYVLKGGRPELRHVTLGQTNTQYIEVVEGLAQGEEVVLAFDSIGVPDAVMQQMRVDTPQFEQTPLVSAPDEDPGVEIEYDGTLLGPGGSVCETEYEIVTFEDGRIERKFEVEVQNGPAGATVDVTVGGVLIGEVTYDETGYVKRKWKTEKDTFPDNFPIESGRGTVVTVGRIEGQLKGK